MFIYNFRRLSNLINEKLDQVIENKLRTRGFDGILSSHAQIMFYLLKKRKHVSIKELVKISNRVKSTVTGILKNLEKHDYIIRTQSPKDRRVTYISLTAKSWKFEVAMKEISSEIEERVISKLSSEIIRSFMETLNLIHTGI